MSDSSSLVHTQWNLCEYKGVEILKASLCPDHVQMLVSIQPKMSVSSFMG